MIRNRLLHIPDTLFYKYVSFSCKSPDIVKPEYMLQKLIIFDFVYPILTSHKHEEILEVGCGQGIHSSMLSEFGHVTATDLVSPGSFAGAEQDVEKDRKNIFTSLAQNDIPFFHNDGRRLPFSDNSFDVIFHNSVIEHVYDAVQFNKEIFRVLRRDGICICITGTPVLCWFRLVRDYLLLLPIVLLVSAYREMVTSGRFPKISSKFRRLTSGDADPETCSRVRVRELYSRLLHYIGSPEYNRIVVEDIAASYGISVNTLLACVVRHFEASSWNRFLFHITPHTHGQHYRNVLNEMKEWNIRKWVEKSEAAGLAVEEVIPYRYHHLFEISFNIVLNSFLYHRFAKIIHKLNALDIIKPSCASEFILVSRKRNHSSVT